ncbi:MAG: folate-binding protein [Rhodobacteraceae bacterium]|nr:folate-binding protein [Paracoccaceae bacterium]
MTSRRILLLSGRDAVPFLQGLVTNDVGKLEDGGLIYAALLSPQGKYLFDFFLKRSDAGVLLDVAEPAADALVRRLGMYRLRADVQIAPAGLHLQRGTGPAPDGADPDPRHPQMGWRAYTEAPEADDGTDWQALRVAHLIPETGIELTGDTFILEAGFERLKGVDFRKGCYVGQEVTARMKHKTTLRKGLALVEISGAAEPGTEITAGGKPAGLLHSRAGDRALAYLRYDRATGQIDAGGANLRILATPFDT